MLPKDGNFFKNPHIVVQEIAGLKVSLHLSVAKKHPATSAAMSIVAETEIKDDEARKKGNDNYNLSIDKLMDAFDTFVRETKDRKTAGSDDIYDLSRPCDLTIRLLWVIRHTWTHKGGIVDEKCKVDYEKIIGISNLSSVFLDTLWC